MWFDQNGGGVSLLNFLDFGQSLCLILLSHFTLCLVYIFFIILTHVQILL